MTSRRDNPPVQVTLRISEDLLAAIDRIAAQQHRSRNAQINRALFIHATEASLKEQGITVTEEIRSGL